MRSCRLQRFADHALLKQGDRAEVTQLLPTNVGPHDHQARRCSEAFSSRCVSPERAGDGRISGGSGQNASSPKKIIDSAKELTIATEEIEGHDHDHTEGEKQAEAGHSHDHGEFNLHIWLDPKRAIQQVENIRDGLIAADPQGKRFTRRTQRRMLRNCENSTAKLPQPSAQAKHLCIP